MAFSGAAELKLAPTMCRGQVRLSGPVDYRGWIALAGRDGSYCAILRFVGVGVEIGVVVVPFLVLVGAVGVSVR